ncbi:hypothetical protein F511_13059 [Dorcoceras hygrometricum]|uniref:Uncharacterized protein n=1 Tax=Dorcoceras hygrometricum TaxID=472368 RepID=A0A2Z7BB23_9LAMI|nr:hypothetical protein F511_13059 [Dorcoceras hygrometricum]
MGFPFHKNIFLLGWILMIFKGYFLGGTVEATTLEDVCRMSYDQHLCLNDFGPSMKTAPIPTLANLAIRKVIDNMNMTRITIEFLLYFSVDPKDHDILNYCKNSYGPPFSSLVASAYYNMKHGQYRRLGQQAVAAFNAADRCQDAYAAYFLKARFQSYMNDLKRMSYILHVIVNEFLL